MANQGPEQTESLFNVTPARRRTYLVAFVAYSLIGYGVVIWHHATDGAPLVNWEGESHAATTAMSVMLGFAIAHAAAFGMALTVAETTGGAMVIADWLREKYVKPLKEKNEAEQERRRAEGRAEVNRVWREWNERRLEAEARGEQFNEPEPFSDDA